LTTITHITPNRRFGERLARRRAERADRPILREDLGVQSLIGEHWSPRVSWRSLDCEASTWRGLVLLRRAS
jgi:hypothetical protein